MKTSKVLALAGITLASVTLLAACSSNSSTESKTYTYVYTSEPDTLDYLLTQRASTNDLTTNGVDGLLANDKYGNLEPAVAEDWTVSADGLTYTYKLRKDAKWFTTEGEEYAGVTAKDFVAGLKHAADNKSDSLYLVQDSIKGLDAYVKGEDKDFSHVGIKAVDDYTLEYTLNQPESFWNSKTTMGILMPVNEEFLTSKGSDFGKATDPGSILYNGPFIIKGMTSKSSVEYDKNPGYWDKDKVKVDHVKFAYYDGQDQESLARNFTDGAYSIARLFPTSSNYATMEKQYKDNIFYTSQGVSTTYYNFNVNRQVYNHTAKTTDAQKESTKKAVLNKDFRQAINFAFDRTAYASQINGKDGASHIIRTSYIPTDFVSIGDKNFGAVSDEKLQTLGDEWKGVETTDGIDKIFNPEKAKAEFAKAKAALQAEGVEFPIHLDVAVVENNPLYVQRSSSLKQSIESALGTENVVVDLNMMSDDEFNKITYFAETAAQKDYDLDGGGWNPDYQDPSTYLDTFDPENGGVLTGLGLTPGQDKEIVAKVGLNDYKTLLDTANKESTDLTKRYETYAAAQAWLTDSSLVMPVYSTGGAPVVSRIVPYTNSYAQVGGKGSTYLKYVEVQSEPVKAADFEAARKNWLKEKADSNAQYQKDLEKHVK